MQQPMLDHELFEIAKSEIEAILRNEELSVRQVRTLGKMKILNDRIEQGRQQSFNNSRMLEVLKNELRIFKAPQEEDAGPVHYGAVVTAENRQLALQQIKDNNGRDLYDEYELRGLPLRSFHTFHRIDRESRAAYLGAIGEDLQSIVEQTQRIARCTYALVRSLKETGAERYFSATGEPKREITDDVDMTLVEFCKAFVSRDIKKSSLIPSDRLFFTPYGAAFIDLGRRLQGELDHSTQQSKKDRQKFTAMRQYIRHLLEDKMMSFFSADFKIPL